jgi:hypothetical protein
MCHPPNPIQTLARLEYHAAGTRRVCPNRFDVHAKGPGWGILTAYHDGGEGDAKILLRLLAPKCTGVRTNRPSNGPARPS